MIQLHSSNGSRFQIQEPSLPEVTHSATPTPPTPSISSRVSPWLASLVYPLGYHIVLPFYFGEIKVTGQEHLPSEGPVILAPTHRSRWDALIVPYAAGFYATGRHLRFMVSTNEIKGLQGWLIQRLGGFPVDTDRPGIGSFRHGVELLLEGEMLVIFPEGNIFRDRLVHPLKRGLAHIALEVESTQPGLGIKIVPISIKYSQAVPSWGCDVKVDIAPAVSVASYGGKSIKRSAKQLTADLEVVLKEVNQDKTCPQA